MPKRRCAARPTTTARRSSSHPTSPPAAVAETLLHEILHCVTESAGINAELGEAEEEKLVRRVAPLLLDVLRRNPDLVAYLTGGAA